MCVRVCVYVCVGRVLHQMDPCIDGDHVYFSGYLTLRQSLQYLDLHTNPAHFHRRPENLKIHNWTSEWIKRAISNCT